MRLRDLRALKGLFTIFTIRPSSLAWASLVLVNVGSLRRLAPTRWKQVSKKRDRGDAAQVDPTVRRRAAFTLIELLVVTALAAVLIGLMLPAVQRVRESRNRLTCQNNLRQLALACLYYHDTHQHLPPLAAIGAFASPQPSLRLPPGRRTSWCLELFPYLELGAIHSVWEFQYVGNDGRENPAWYGNFAGPDAPGARTIPILLCPSHALGPIVMRFEPTGLAPGGVYMGVISYRASANYNAAFWMESRVRLTDVTDGTAQTFLVGEHANREPLWRWINDPLTVSLPDGPSYFRGAYADGPHAFAANRFNARLNPVIVGAPAAELGGHFNERVFSFGSDHPGGANFALCDGSVRFVSDAVNSIIFAAAGTIDGGETAIGF